MLLKKWKKYIDLGRINTTVLTVGIWLNILSFIVPAFINVKTFAVIDHLYYTLEYPEKYELMITAFLLVAMNTLRCIPHYAGSFLIGESIGSAWTGRRNWLVSGIIMFLVLRGTYWEIEQFTGIYYDFGLPTILIFLFEVMLHKMNYRFIANWKKIMLLIALLTAFQFMDIMPALAMFHVGRGETSLDIKLAAEVMGAESALNVMGLTGMTVFLLFSTIVLFQFRVENGLREMRALEKENYTIRLQAQKDEIENRTNKELHYLVHDLKSPLTATQTLTGILKMKSEAEGREEDTKLLSKIEEAVERMSGMISELLYENQQAAITTEELVRTIMAQISVSDYGTIVQVDNTCPDEVVCANRILFPRAIINLLQNSARAVKDKKEPKIVLAVRSDEAHAFFTVSDNGVGIKPENQSAIWEYGVSTEASTGIGLAFVRKVVSGMNGEIKMSSTENVGTTTTIMIPREE